MWLVAKMKPVGPAEAAEPVALGAELVETVGVAELAELWFAGPAEFGFDRAGPAGCFGDQMKGAVGPAELWFAGPAELAAQGAGPGGCSGGPI